MDNLVNYEDWDLETCELLVDNSSEHKCMKEFINTSLSDVLASIGAGKSTLNTIGVGPGSGEIDLEILKVLQEQHPDTRVEHEVVEPSSTMLKKYKDILSETSCPVYTTISWKKMTAKDFENEWKNINSGKKIHFISMIQMLYFVQDIEGTISFFRSLLHKDGKLLIIMVSGESAWGRLMNDFQDELGPLIKTGTNLHITSKEIKHFLDSTQIPYRKYKLTSLLDITESFIPGDVKGELLLDLLTEVIDFSKTAPPEIKHAVLEFLKHPDNIQDVNSRILFDCSMEAMLIDAEFSDVPQ